MAYFLVPDAILFKFSSFLRNSNCVQRTDGRTDKRMDGPMDRLMDIPSYRDAKMHLKSPFSLILTCVMDLRIDRRVDGQTDGPTVTPYYRDVRIIQNASKNIILTWTKQCCELVNVAKMWCLSVLLFDSRAKLVVENWSFKPKYGSLTNSKNITVCRIQRAFGTYVYWLHLFYRTLFLTYKCYH